MKNDDILRKLQLAELDVLKRVINILDDKGIRYYALGGTVLGAVRHHGFIPWDDDIDIGVPREYFEKLPELLTAEGLSILYHDNNKKMIHIKVVDESITIVWNHYDQEECTPAWIDIFPLDAIPKNIIRRRICELRIYFRRDLFGISCNRMINKKRSRWRECCWKIIHFFHLYRLLNPEITYQRFHRLLIHYSKSNSGITDNYFINAVGPYKYHEAHPIYVYGIGELHKFEDIYINLPIDTDYYLRTLYGSSYMSPPPVEKRNHHLTKEIIFMEKLKESPNQ